jgi:hypothetical protein
VAFPDDEGDDHAFIDLLRRTLAWIMHHGGTFWALASWHDPPFDPAGSV